MVDPELKKNSLAFNFQAAVQGMRRQYPVLSDNTVFYNAADQSVSLPPWLAPHEEGDIAATALRIAEGHPSFATKFIPREGKLKGQEVQLIGINFANIDHAAFMPSSVEMGKQANFDHECGHAVVDLRDQKEHVVAVGEDKIKHPIVESAADVFMLLKHVKRYGDQADDVGYTGWMRAYYLWVHGDAKHFTSVAVDHLIEQGLITQAKNMQPEQIAKTASEVSFATRLPDALVTHLYEKSTTCFYTDGRFSPVQGFMKLCDAVLNDQADIPAVARYAAARFLEPVLADKLDDKYKVPCFKDGRDVMSMARGILGEAKIEALRERVPKVLGALPQIVESLQKHEAERVNAARQEPVSFKQRVLGMFSR